MALLPLFAMVLLAHGQYMPVVSQAHELSKQGKYLPALVLLRSAYATCAPRDREVLGQWVGLYTAMLGEPQDALEIFDKLMKPEERERPGGINPQDYRAEEAIQAIVTASRGHRLVMLNEAHHVPLCRAFALKVARALRKEGFAYFAAETFNPTVTEAWMAGYPKVSIGHYTREPMYGQLIREAMKMGYRPIYYEADATEWAKHRTEPNYREKSQARNLLKALAEHPKGRFFVLCGYDHISEHWYPGERQYDNWLAAYIRRQSPLDPLTVDQTEELPHTIATWETDEYKALAESLRGPTVFRRPSGEYAVIGRFFGAVDMQVFHPRYKMLHGRQSWLYGTGRIPYTLPSAVKHERGEVLVQAFVASEPADAVPSDQVLLSPGTPMPVLMLPRGTYRLLVQHPDGHTAVLASVIHV
jgi:hypothetical protein